MTINNSKSLLEFSKASQKQIVKIYQSLTHIIYAIYQHMEYRSIYVLSLHVTYSWNMPTQVGYSFVNVHYSCEKSHYSHAKGIISPSKTNQ